MGRARHQPPTHGPRRVLLSLLAGLVGASCSVGDDDSAPVVAADISETVPIGAVPDQLSDLPTPSTPPNLASTTTTSTTEPITPLDGPIGEQVDGDRLLLIGDAVLAQTAPRFDGLACDVLTDFGWSVEVAAEPGRFIDFGHEVLDARFDPDAGLDWDAVVILLGNLFDGDLVDFESQLTGLIERLEPRPVVLFTLTEVDDEEEVNDLIRAQPDIHPNVVVVDWAEASASEPEVLLENGGPIPTVDGAARIVVFIAGELGDAPVADEADEAAEADGAVDDDAQGEDDGQGECLPEVFTDDSAIVLRG